jgi:hypothetical protein
MPIIRQFLHIKNRIEVRRAARKEAAVLQKGINRARVVHHRDIPFPTSDVNLADIVGERIIRKGRKELRQAFFRLVKGGEMLRARHSGRCRVHLKRGVNIRVFPPARGEVEIERMVYALKFDS